MRLARSIVFLLSSLLFQACSQEGIQDLQASFRRGIIHGTEISESNHPEAVKLLVGNALCTGVFVRENPPTALTASHCLKNLPTKTSNDGGVRYGTVKSRRACVPEGAIAHVNPYDLAVVVFEEDSFSV